MIKISPIDSNQIFDFNWFFYDLFIYSIYI